MPGRQPLILFINKDLNESDLRALLPGHGYKVIAADNDRQGYSVLRKNPVDAIILDLETPGLLPANSVRRMKALKPYVPVLLLALPGNIPVGKFSADAVVLKDDAPARLLDVLDHLLNVRFPFFARWFGNWKHRESA